jgi:uncharacterized protein
VTTTPIVTVRGEARLEAPPDLATLSATVHSSGSSAAVVRDELARASSRVREVLEERSAILEFHTSGLHVTPVFDRKSGTKITGYRGSFTTSIEVRDFDGLSDLVFSLTPLPNCQLDGPWWSLRAENPVYREVRLAAITDARRRADDYAAAVGMTVAELVEISDLDSGGFAPSPMRSRAFAMDAAESAPSFDFEPAMQSVSGQVTVRFTLAAPST